MKILLDSHIFIWLRQAPELLSRVATSLIENEENHLFLSMASIWEMQIKIDLKKLTLSHHLFDVVSMERRENNIRPLS